MPTRSGRRLLSQSIWYFLRQDIRSCELIVLDDGEHPIDDLIPTDRRIRHVVMKRAPLDVLVRRGRELAEGEYLADWHVDAWYSPVRLSSQLHHLVERGAAVTALTGLLHYQPLTGRVWQRTGAKGPFHSLLYHRDNSEALAGNVFLVPMATQEMPKERRSPAGHVAIQLGAELAAVILQGSGTGPVNAADPSWQPRPFAEVERVLGPDLTSYAPGPTSRVPGPSRGSLRRTEVAPTTVAGTFMVYDGYGSMAEYLAVGMSRAGADVQIAPFRIDATATSAEFRGLLDRSRPDLDGVVVAHAWWGENLARFGSARDFFIKTVWETSRLPADWPRRLDAARAVIVPSDFAARVFRESGVSVPVEVVYEGADPDVYPYFERPERQGATTLVVGVLAPRKNYHHAVAAWKEAFGDDPDARLILKARFQVERYVPDDPRVRVVDTNEATRGILHWYREADILLALGNEGFGLPVVEGMATGLPVVALDAEAQADIVAATRHTGAPALLPVEVARWEKVESPVFGDAGVRAVPNVEHAAEQLRWAADHPTAARELGRRASAWAHVHRNVWDMGPATLAALERHASTSRPLRRTHVVWAVTAPVDRYVDAHARGNPDAFVRNGLASWSTQHYARNVARFAGQSLYYDRPPLPDAALHRAVAAAWRSPLLHVHVTPGEVDEEALTRQVQVAGQRGMAVIVTEHGRRGDGRARAWEQSADVLTAPDAGAAAILKSIWPSKRVELLPPGCPPWRPAPEGPGRRIAVLAPSAEDDLSAELDGWARAAEARWFLLPPHWAATDDGDRLARWLNASADVVLSVPAAAATPLLERIGLASGLPVVSACEARNDVATDLRRALGDPLRRAELVDYARAQCAETSWPRIGARHSALWRMVLT